MFIGISCLSTFTLGFQITFVIAPFLNSTYELFISFFVHKLKNIAFALYFSCFFEKVAFWRKYFY